MQAQPLLSGNNLVGDGSFFRDQCLLQCAELPSHYGWKQPQHLDELTRQYEALADGNRPGSKVTQRITRGGKLFTVWRDDSAAKRTVAELEREVHDILSQLDAQGRWVTVYDGKTRLVGQPKFEAGFRFIGSNVFNYNVEILSDYIAATAQR